MLAARLVLLLAGVVGAVLRPFRLPAYVAPVGCGLIAVAAGLISWGETGRALTPFEAPLAFLLAAIPLAVLLDRLGYFEQVASLFGGGRMLPAGLWLLGTGTVAVLNLDAAVVLLTPIYVRVARRQGRCPLLLGFQPVILALLASSYLPVSNLTNLLAQAKLSVEPLAFCEHLALPTAVGCLVGYFCYQFFAPQVAGTAKRVCEHHPAASARTGHDKVGPAKRREVMVVGSIVVFILLVGFVLGPTLGIAEWQVALGADLLLVAFTRSLPLSSIPWGTALIAAGLGVLAATAVKGMDLRGLLAGRGSLAFLREALVSAAGANAVNNLPALLVSLPFMSNQSGHASCALWPVLLGVNAGPGLLVTGSLASLLWADSMRQMGVHVTPWQYFEIGVVVVVPAFAASLAVLILLSPMLGCG
jgi:arsenical pump membrane protein